MTTFGCNVTCVSDKGTRKESCDDKITAKTCNTMGGQVESRSCAELGYKPDGSCRRSAASPPVARPLTNPEKIGQNRCAISIRAA